MGKDLLLYRNSNGDLLEKLIAAQLAKKFPAFYGALMFVTIVTRTRHLFQL
jgi:hypothetical protein